MAGLESTRPFLNVRMNDCSCRDLPYLSPRAIRQQRAQLRARRARSAVQTPRTRFFRFRFAANLINSLWEFDEASD